MVKLLKVGDHRMTSRKPNDRRGGGEVIICSCGASCRPGIRKESTAEQTWLQHVGTG